VSAQVQLLLVLDEQAEVWDGAREYLEAKAW